LLHYFIAKLTEEEKNSQTLRYTKPVWKKIDASQSDNFNINFKRIFRINKNDQVFCNA